jgi:tRNA threonylcarbamoyladenosine biosynthesis protein TsaB
LFRAEQGALTRIAEDRAIALSELAEEIKSLEEPIFLVGDGSILCYNTLKQDVPALVLPPEHRMHQRAAGVALVAKQMIARGENCDGAALQPNYLRLSQAERELAEKRKQSS